MESNLHYEAVEEVKHVITMFLGAKMNCPRCTGLMVQDDLQDETGLACFAAWRCVVCGEVLDPVILENRSAASNLMVDRGRHWPKIQFVSTGQARSGKIRSFHRVRG
jgi:hypothetical protein